MQGLSKGAFLQLPEVVARCNVIGAKRFAHEFAWMEFHPRVLLAGIVIPGSIAGIKKLSALGQIVYYTARYSTEQQRHSGMVAATYQWLEEQRFPNADQVVFCAGVADKVRRLAELVHAGHHIIAIDDSYVKILQHMPAHDFPRNTFKLVGLRAPSTACKDLFPLKNWHYIDQLINHLRKDGY